MHRYKRSQVNIIPAGKFELVTTWRRSTTTVSTRPPWSDNREAQTNERTSRSRRL